MDNRLRELAIAIRHSLVKHPASFSPLRNLLLESLSYGGQPGHIDGLDVTQLTGRLEWVLKQMLTSFTLKEFLQHSKVLKCDGLKVSG